MPPLNAVPTPKNARSSMPKSVACIGAGYAGGTTCAMIASKCPNLKVTVADVDAAKIAQWNSDSLPFYEPGLENIVKQCRERNLFFTTDVDKTIADAELIFIAVNTPTKTHGKNKGYAFEMRHVEDAARCIAKNSTGHKIIVEKSTVPVKTAQQISSILKHGNASFSYQILSNPEFLAEGTAIENLSNPDRVLIGGESTAAGIDAMNKLVEIYRQWIPHQKIITTNVWSSELSKLVASALLAQRVSTINAVSMICERTGADIREVATAIGHDSRISPKFLQPSVGFGGSCFQKDALCLVYLARTLNLHEVADYFESVVTINNVQRRRFADRIVRELLDSVADKKLAIFGFAYKTNTSDTRESSSIYVASYLLEEHAKIAVYDPKVSEEQIKSDLMRVCGNESVIDSVTVNRDAYEAARGAHAIIVMTEWDEFKTYDYAAIYEQMTRPAWIFDGRLILDHDKLRQIGFRVCAIGTQDRSL